MRFCPKCSLKIKANIEQCPICKVELLSCADDEDVTAHLSEKKGHSQNGSEKSPIPAPPPQTAPPAQEFPPPAEMTPDTAQNDVPPPPPDDIAVLTRKLKSLEDHLVHIEKTIEINSSKDDIIRSSIVDLESKITKVEKTLADQEAVPHDRLKIIEAEIARLSSSTTTTDQGADSKTNGITPLETPPEMPSPSDEGAPSRDFSSPDTGFPEEEISFAEETKDDFESSFGSSIQHQRSPREKKRKLPIALPLIALLLIAVWLLFYYAKPRNKEMQETVVAEKIVLPPLPTTKEVQPKKNTPATPSTDTEKIGKEEGSVLTPPPPDKQLSRTVQKTPAPPQPPLNGSGYTVNVGSFKDKALALTLTTRLQEKGYSALMSPTKGKQFYRVKVGAFSTQKEARAYASLLEEKEKLPTFVTQINQP
jgi:cell division protein FtsN